MWRSSFALAASLLVAPLLAAAGHVIPSARIGWVIDEQRQVVWVTIGTTLYQCNNLNGAPYRKVSTIIRSTLRDLPNAVILAKLERELEQTVPDLCDRMGGGER